MDNTAQIHIHELSYVRKVEAVLSLLKYDNYFRNDLNDDRVESVMELYTLSDFKTLNYCDKTIKDFIIKGMSEGYIAFERVFKNDVLFSLEPLLANELLANYSNVTKSVVWNYSITAKIYNTEELLYIDFTYYFEYLVNKYHTLYVNGKRPNILEHIKKLKREDSVSKLINDEI